MLNIGSVIDHKYKVLDVIGRGGMSVVYLAINERSNKTWAIKEIKKEGRHDFYAVQQSLIAEVNILKNLNHKYLPAIADIIDGDDVYLIVMDYIQGKTLLEMMSDVSIVITMDMVVRWAKQLCEVLGYLHNQKNPVIYRDLKPSNIMIRPDGDIALIDFGAARILKQESLEDTTCLGTPGYAAPEQYGGNGQTNPQTDIYCLGATLHHLITKRSPAPTPFNFPEITQCCPQLLVGRSLDEKALILGLAYVIGRCTQYEAEDRYASCEELMSDLNNLSKVGMPYRKKIKQRKRIVCAFCILMFWCGGMFGAGCFLEWFIEANGYEYYVNNAKLSDQPADMYIKAIHLDPSRVEAYLELLEILAGDEEGLSSKDDAVITTVLYSKAMDRKKANLFFLQEDSDAYIYFAYKLACAYYTADCGNGDKTSAAVWFDAVSDADWDALNLNERVDLQQMKARTEILSRICSFYKRHMIGKVDALGDAVYSYDDYWQDMMALLESDIVRWDTEVMALNFYKEIVFQIYTNAVPFKVEAGIDYSDMDSVLCEVEKKTLAIDSSIYSVCRLKDSVIDNIGLAKDHIELISDVR